MIRESIVPGTQATTVISSPATTGKAAIVARLIARDFEGSRIRRSFPSVWERDEAGALVKTGTVSIGGQIRPLTVKIGVAEGLVLKNASGRGCPLKPSNGEMALEIGSKMNKLQSHSYAHRIAVAYVIHGNNWKDRAEQSMPNPHGLLKQSEMPRQFFHLVDGAVCGTRPTLAELINLGGFRSSHVGGWQLKHSILAPAMCGLLVKLHEFNKNAGQEICTFLGLQISPTPGIWGPYAPWNEQARKNGELGTWTELAMRCSSPFAFHIHATWKLFPRTVLYSDLFLKSIGPEKLRSILELVALKEPERYYRLIDRWGVTHQLTGVENGFLVYGNGERVSIGSAASTVVESFLQMQMMQNDCSYQIPRMDRLVVDTHVYLALSFIARDCQPQYMLSGRKLHGYLTAGKDATMHRVRNERLLGCLRPMLGVDSVRLHVYPPFGSQYDCKSQYETHESFDKDFWLSRKV